MTEPGPGQETTRVASLEGSRIVYVLRPATGQRGASERPPVVLVPVGHSNGVPVVREVYRRIPDRVEALVLVDGALRQVIPEGVRAWMLAALDRPDFDTFYAGMVAQMPVAGLSEQEAALLREAAQATPRDVFVAEITAMTDEATWRADPIVVPVLAIYTSQPHGAATMRTLSVPWPRISATASGTMHRTA